MSSNVGFWSTPAKDLLVGNHRGLLHLFRDDSTEGGRPALLPHETIKVLRGQLSAGSFATPAVSDWDGDEATSLGRKDQIRSCRLEPRRPAGPVDDQQRGNPGSGILYYENCGTNEEPVFFRRHYPKVNGREIRVGSGHAANHCPIDWFETGLTDLLIGNDDGFLQLYRNSFFENPPEIEVPDVVARP